MGTSTNTLILLLQCRVQNIKNHKIQNGKFVILYYALCTVMYKIYNLTVAHKKVKLSLYRSKKAPRAPEG